MASEAERQTTEGPAPVWITAGPHTANTLAPWLMLAIDQLGLVAAVRDHLPPSWGVRLDIWSFTADRTLEDPIRGWGMDASRMFPGYIQLHPHSGALHTVERVSVAPGTRDLIDDVSVEDAKALLRPWRMRYRLKSDPKTKMMEWSCEENNRNPLDENGVTRTTKQGAP